MAYSSLRSIEGPAKKPKKTKVRRKAPSYSTPTAILGGEGVRKTQRAARDARTYTRRERKGMTVEQLRNIEAATKKAPSKKRQRKALKRAIKASTGERPVRATGVSESQREYNEALERFGASYKPPKDPIAKELEGLAPTGIRVVRALTGDKPGSVTPTLGEIANIATTLGAGGAGGALRTGAKAAAAARTTKLKTAAETAKAAEKAAARHGRKAAKKAGTKPKPKGKAKGRAKQAKTKVRTRYSKPERKLRRAQRAERATSRAVNPIAPAVGTSESGRALLEGTAKAITESPGKTAKTTGRALYGMPAALAGDVIDLATGHPGKFIESQEKYLKTLAPLVTGDKEEVQRAIEEDVGLVPHLTAGLGVYAGVRATGKKPSAPSITRVRQKRDVKQAKEGRTPQERREARERLERDEYKEPRTQRKAGEKREAERSSVIGEKERGHLTLDVREGGKRQGKVGRRRRLDKQIAALSREELTDVVSEGDTIGLLSRHGFAKGTKNPVQALKKIRDELEEPSRALDPDTPHTRAVIGALIQRPDVIKDPKVQRAIDQYGAYGRQMSIERHTERTGKRQTTPDPLDEDPRLLPVQREFDVRARSERLPRELRGKTKVKERKGQDATKAVRGEAKGFVMKAKRLEDQAVAQRKAGRKDRAKVLTERAKRYRAEADERLGVVDRHKNAVRLEGQAARAKKAGNSKKARDLRNQAEEIRDIAEAEQNFLRREAAEETSARLREEGRREPIFTPQTDITRIAREADTSVPASRGTKKEKRRKGILEAQGRIDESALALVESIHARRRSLHERERMHGIVDEATLRVDGERAFTGEEISAMRRNGEIPPGYSQVPVQEFAAMTQRNNKLRREIEGKRAATKATQKTGRQLHFLIPEGQINEFRAQGEALRGGWRKLRAANRAQAIAMLATNTGWFQMQMVATPITILVRNPNPRRLAQAARQTVKAWRKLTPRERVDFAAHFGGNPADLLSLGDNIRGGVRNQAVRAEMGRAARVAFKSPLGRVARALATHAKKGGPLIQANRRYEAGLRIYQAMLEMDRLSGVNPSGRTQAFAFAVSKLSDTAHRHMRELQGKKTDAQVRAYLDNPKMMRELERQTNEAYGNWMALTAKERKLSSVTSFYGFLRFSLGWIGKFPRDNPVKTAVYMNLAQSNAQELSELLGGDPGFWRGWATAVHHAGGEPALLDLSRALPGGNILAEAVGDAAQAGVELPQAIALGAARALSPILGGAAAATFDKDPFGHESDLGFVKQNLENVASLNNLMREKFQRKIDPPSEISQLFREIDDRSGLERMFLADAFPDAEGEAEAAHLSRLLDIAFGDDEEAASEAWEEIDALQREYGIEAAEEPEADSSGGTGTPTSTSIFK